VIAKIVALTTFDMRALISCVREATGENVASRVDALGIGLDSLAAWALSAKQFAGLEADLATWDHSLEMIHVAIVLYDEDGVFKHLSKFPISKALLHNHSKTIVILQDTLGAWFRFITESKDFPELRSDLYDQLCLGGCSGFFAGFHKEIPFKLRRTNGRS
jgi:hypothetical protein